MDHASIVAYVKQKASEVFRKDSYVSMRKRLRIRDLRRSKVSRERLEKSSVRSCRHRFCGNGIASELSVKLALTAPFAHSCDNVCHGQASVDFLCECLLPEWSIVLEED